MPIIALAVMTDGVALAHREKPRRALRMLAAVVALWNCDAPQFIYFAF